jgi:acyl-CoA synthetase (AMP-forming)/AMP-acid ligase II
VRVGDRVAALASPTIDTVALALGCWRAGAVLVPLGLRGSDEERAHVVADSGARVVDVDALRGGPPREDVVPDEEAPALLLYTSGTTGRSKGVALPWRALVRNMLALGDAWRFAPGDVLCHMLPLDHVHGLCIGVVAALLHRVRLRLHARFDPSALVDDFAHGGATVFMGVPTMYAKLVAHLERDASAAAALGRARLFTAGSAALPARDLERFAALTGHIILERYGMTETLITLSNPYAGERRAGSVGFPVAGCEVAVVDEHGAAVGDGTAGEIVVRGDSLMSGYWNRPDDTRAAIRDGWFHTGDVGVREADGRFRIVGRMSTDIVKSGGYKIGTREIEEVIATHADVVDVAVFGVPDDVWGERVAAAIVVRAGAVERTADAWLAELAALVGARLSDYKKPRAVLVLDALPRNAMGKLRKARLAELARAQRTSTVSP